MKNNKIFLCLVIFAVLCAASSLVYAQGAKHLMNKPQGMENITGTVVSVDTVKDQVVIKDEMTGAEKTYSVKAKSANLLKAGEKVVVSLKKGTDTALSIKVVKPQK